MNLGGSELVVVLVIVLVLFGGSQLPKLAKNLGKAQKEFKEGLGEAQKADAKAEAKPEARVETKTEASSGDA